MVLIPKTGGEKPPTYTTMAKLIKASSFICVHDQGGVLEISIGCEEDKVFYNSSEAGSFQMDVVAKNRSGYRNRAINITS